MCFFLTVAVPKQHIGRIHTAFGRGFQTFPHMNSTIASVLPNGYGAQLVTSGMCSCDLYFPPHSESDSDRVDHRRRKLVKRGWSKEKINRAIEQSEINRTKSEFPKHTGLRSDVVERLQALCRVVGGLAILVHWYDGDVSTERISLRHTERCECAQLPEKAMGLEQDEMLLVVFRREHA